MSAATDKARFYQEQSIPELRELERKKIFTKPEITSIAKKRSDFEHKLNGRGSHPSDYVLYAEYEMNLDALRRKRVSRMGIKVRGHAGQRRIFFILDRATRKFQGDIGLWMQYISFARKQKSNKKVSEILTRALRLHPTKPDLWIYAAKYAIEVGGDMVEARSYMQRALRFCEKAARLWIEYARLELIYIAKIAGRRQILGIGQAMEEPKDMIEESGDMGGNVLALPAITAEEIQSEVGSEEILDKDALEKIDSSPALSGAIPVAIFDAALKHLGGDDQFLLQFYDMVAEFDRLPCHAAILEHIMEALRSVSPQTPATLLRFIRQPVEGIHVKLADFPMALADALSRIKLATKALQSAQSRSILNRGVMEWLLPYLEEEGLDPDIRQVIEMTLKKLWNQYQADIELRPNGMAEEVSGLLNQLEAKEIVVPGRA
ncbi:MAG: hypothetical protein Q9163_004648 [Psora crenata]